MKRHLIATKANPGNLHSDQLIHFQNETWRRRNEPRSKRLWDDAAKGKNGILRQDEAE